jgi:hypothetical protein
MSNLFGFDDQITCDVRLNGIGWIGAMLVSVPHRAQGLDGPGANA